ncbi:MAG: winged helix-turn-helix domain-containing protein, partial [Spirochaetia bacterium]|nr:winged helix-turn-helix domain-containing protein [Spirochaetia bacterium]
MKDAVALLASNNELIDDFKTNLADMQIMLYRNVDAVKQDNYGAILIDIEILESPDSVQFYLSKIRKKIRDVPVIIIIRVIHCAYIRKDWFIDDFVMYPFRRMELITRVNRLILRDGDDENIITAGNLQIDLSEYSVYLDNQRLQLTYKEFELLRLFIQNRGIVFSRQDLLGKIWGIKY